MKGHNRGSNCITDAVVAHPCRTTIALNNCHYSETKNEPKEEGFGRTSLRTSGQKLQSGPPIPEKKKTSILARTCRADVQGKNFGLKNFRLIFHSIIVITYLNSVLTKWGFLWIHGFWWRAVFILRKRFFNTFKVQISSFKVRISSFKVRILAFKVQTLSAIPLRSPSKGDQAPWSLKWMPTVALLT